jgi:hypothetical protein
MLLPGSQCVTRNHDRGVHLQFSQGWGDDNVAVYGVETDLPVSSYSCLDRFVRCSDWPAFEREMRNAVCGVTVLPDLAGNPHIKDLIEVKRIRPAYPIVLVTRPDFANVVYLRYVPVDEVVPLDCSPSSLAASVARAVQGTTYRRIESRIHSAVLPEQLRRALLHLWHATPCIVSVDKLAVLLGCGRSTLYGTWSGAFGGRPPCSVKEVIGWIVLVRMIQLRDAGHSWKRVERTLGVGASTLDRTAGRLLHQSRASVSFDRAAVLSRFETDVLRSLLDPCFSRATAAT